MLWQPGGMSLDGRRLSPVFGAMITLCVLCAVFVDVPGMAIVGWTLVLVFAAAWMVTMIRSRNSSDER